MRSETIDFQGEWKERQSDEHKFRRKRPARGRLPA